MLFIVVYLQRWARAYRDDQYHAAVETKNGTEAMNKLMKYRYLPRQKNITLSNLTSKIVEEFVPALQLQVRFYELQADFPVLAHTTLQLYQHTYRYDQDPLFYTVYIEKHQTSSLVMTYMISLGKLGCLKYMARTKHTG